MILAWLWDVLGFSFEQVGNRDRIASVYGCGSVVVGPGHVYKINT